MDRQENSGSFPVVKLRRPNEIECEKIRCTGPPTPRPSSESKDEKFATVRGSLIHFLKAADGTLRWLPPSSSYSQAKRSSESHRHRKPDANNGHSSRCSSGEMDKCDALAGEFSMLNEFESSFGQAEVRVKGSITCREEAEESSGICPASPDLTPRFRDRGDSDSSAIHDSVEAAQEGTSNDMSTQDVIFMLQRESSDARNQNSVQPKLSCSSTDRTKAAALKLSPYLSSKLKPGRHILAEKKQRVYIRPGQLRHWARANSPTMASNLANLQRVPHKNNRKACRTLF